MSAHTPLPWIVSPAVDKDGAVEFHSADLNGPGDYAGQAYTLANAQRIVLCVNAHDDLLTVLKRIRGNIDVSTIRPGRRNEQRWTELAEAADAAIAKAEGKS